MLLDESGLRTSVLRARSRPQGPGLVTNKVAYPKSLSDSLAKSWPPGAQARPAAEPPTPLRSTRSSPRPRATPWVRTLLKVRRHRHEQPALVDPQQHGATKVSGPQREQALLIRPRCLSGQTVQHKPCCLVRSCEPSYGPYKPNLNLRPQAERAVPTTALEAASRAGSWHYPGGTSDRGVLTP